MRDSLGGGKEVRWEREEKRCRRNGPVWGWDKSSRQERKECKNNCKECKNNCTGYFVLRKYLHIVSNSRYCNLIHNPFPASPNFHTFTLYILPLYNVDSLLALTSANTRYKETGVQIWRSLPPPQKKIMFFNIGVQINNK